MEVGKTYKVGDEYNNFFRSYFEHSPVWPVKYGEKNIISTAPALNVLMKCIDNTIQSTDIKDVTKPNFQETYFLGLRYATLARELIWEQVRLSHFPDHPSRQKCLWLCDQDSIKFWIDQIKNQEGKFQILEVSATGNACECYQNFLLCILHAKPEYIKNAHSYWKGEVSGTYSKEILFEGSLFVKKVIEIN